MKRQGGVKNQKGQVIVEYILMMVVVFGVGLLFQKFFKDTKIAQKFTIEPWGRLNGMIQCGTWTPCGVDTKAPGLHPNTKERVLSLDPKTL
jgi:hypothetical protein